MNVIKVIQNLTGFEVTPSTRFDESGMDSLDMFEIIMEVEDEFQVNITDETVQSFTTVQDLMDYVNANNQKPSRVAG